MIYPSISIIIPVRNSAHILPVCLSGVRAQSYPKNKIEVIVVDNNSGDNTIAIAMKDGAAIVSVPGKPPLVCQQRNMGAKKAKGEYLLFLDHDMELSRGVLRDFARKSKAKQDVKAWFIPEKIITESKFLTQLRNFERGFYNQTPVDAVRIIEKKSFLRTESQYDPKLSGGPADWDLDIQLREIGCQFGTISEPLYHHEERLGGIVKYILKKSDWMGGISSYKKKWSKKYHGKYLGLVNQQLGFKYRALIIFSENGKWKKVIRRPDLYLGVMCTKLAMLCLSLVKAK